MTKLTCMIGAVALGAAALLCATPAVAGAVADFDARFHDETLRVDYLHGGDAMAETVTLDRVYRQGIWAGSRTRLIDDLDLGSYYHHLYDAASGELLYSRGLDTYFGEYRTTAPAAAGVARRYHETALLPCPRAPAEFAVLARDRAGELREIFRAAIDPDHYTVDRTAPPGDVAVVIAHEGGDPHGCVDVVILGDGYTAAQADKFERDVRHFAAVLLGHQPYARHAASFNIRGVLKPSLDSGCDEPSRGVWARTALGCTFDSLGSERYLLTEDNRALRDVAAHVPYDALYVMVNHERYGGGGIYNLFNTFTTDNQWSDFVFLHEFGHHFAGLADEYYTSQIAYGEFYPRGVEPREVNITRLPDPAAVKWAGLATPGAPVPTPWNKAAYDAEDIRYQQERAAGNEHVAALMLAGAPADEVEAAKAAGEELSRSHQAWVDSFVAASPWRDTVGAFEGAGYDSEGMYRSQLDCIMFTKGIKPFCAACTRGIERVIARYGE